MIGNTYNANIDIKNTTTRPLGAIQPSDTLLLKDVLILFDNEAGVKKQILLAASAHVPTYRLELEVNLVAKQETAVKITATFKAETFFSKIAKWLGDGV